MTIDPAWKVGTWVEFSSRPSPWQVNPNLITKGWYANLHEPQPGEPESYKQRLIRFGGDAHFAHRLHGQPPMCRQMSFAAYWLAKRDGSQVCAHISSIDEFERAWGELWQALPNIPQQNLKPPLYPYFGALMMSEPPFSSLSTEEDRIAVIKESLFPIRKIEMAGVRIGGIVIDASGDDSDEWQEELTGQFGRKITITHPATPDGKLLGLAKSIIADEYGWQLIAEPRPTWRWQYLRDPRVGVCTAEGTIDDLAGGAPPMSQIAGPVWPYISGHGVKQGDPPAAVRAKNALRTYKHVLWQPYDMVYPTASHLKVAAGA